MSSVTGKGMDDFLGLVSDARREYETDYRKEYQRLREAKKEAEEKVIMGGIHSITKLGESDGGCY